jgi:hypothetical protein
MAKKGKLELTRVGKDERVKLEPRVLVEDPAKSYGDPKTENMLIYGDNLLALKALEQDFAGQIKCICIDPPCPFGKPEKSLNLSGGVGPLEHIPVIPGHPAVGF